MRRLKRLLLVPKCTYFWRLKRLLLVLYLLRSMQFVARRRKVVPHPTIATEECADPGSGSGAGFVDTMLSALTERKSGGVWHSVVAVRLHGLQEVEQRMEQLPRRVVRNAG